MIDHLLLVGLSNVGLALVLAVAAVVVNTKLQRPQIAHVLWVLVLLKLVTPPMFSIPLKTVGPPVEVASEVRIPTAAPRFDLGDDRWAGLFPSESLPASIQHRKLELPVARLTWYQSATALLGPVKGWLLGIWLVGSVFVTGWSLVRVVRFDRMLQACSGQVPDELSETARQLAVELGLRSVPRLVVTSAAVSPMVWWIGRRVQVVIPRLLLEELPEREWRLVLAHELAHVKRGDYLVRWIEWLVCVLWWWNPLAWCDLPQNPDPPL